MLMRISAFVILFMCANIAARCQSAPRSSSPTSAAPAKSTKVWTNDDLSNLKGGVSVVGKGASASRANNPEVAYGEETDNITITSPADGTVVQPGETISVEVEVASSTQLAAVGLVSPIGAEQAKQSAPYTFNIHIPAGDEPGNNGPLIGNQPIYAFGISPERKFFHSSPVTLDVERSDFPVSLGPQISSLAFEAIGESFPLIMLAKFPDGAVLEANNSTYFSFSSSDPAIATVDKYGIVTASGPGSTSIIASYSNQGRTVDAKIPVAFEHPVMTIQPNSLTFGPRSAGSKSETRNVTITNQVNYPMTIVELTVTPGFSETDDCRRTAIPSHSSCTIHVTFTPLQRGRTRGTLTVGSKVIGIPTQIPLDATVK